MPDTINVEIRRGDFSAEVARAGKGPPLLYLHGAVGQKGWAPFLDRLAQTFTVYAPTLCPATARRHRTGALDRPDRSDLYHLELLNQLGVARAHIVGHFLGGMIAAEMAAFSPSSVHSLVLVSPAGVWRDEEPVADLLALNASELSERLTATPDGATARIGRSWPMS